MLKTKNKKLVALILSTLTLSTFLGCASPSTKSTETTAVTTEASASSTEANTSSPETEAPKAQETEADSSTSDTLFTSMKTKDLEGNDVDSSVFAENDLTLVNVWNEGCTPCIEEIPILDQLNKEYASKGVSIKGLIYEFEPGISDESRKAVEEILSKANSEYQQLTASEDMINSETLQNVLAFPTTYFVDSKGNIIDTVEGSNDYDGWKTLIENTLKKVTANE